MNRRWVARDDTGAYAIMYAVLVLVLIGMASLVVDLAVVRADKRDSRSAADFASLAGANDLGTDPYTPRKACITAAASIALALNITLDSSGCSTLPADGTTPCPTTAGAPATLSSGDVTVYITWPVLDGSSAMTAPDGLAGGDTRAGNTAFDGTSPCLRLAVQLQRTRTLGLASALGVGHATSTAASVARKTINPGGDEFTYPLVVLEQSSCGALKVGGTNANILVQNGGSAYPGVPGRIAVDSDGSTNCFNKKGQQTDSILGVNGQTFIQTQDSFDGSPDPTHKGAIEVFGPTSLPAATVASGTNVPCQAGATPTNTPCVGQTTVRGQRVTRTPFDLVFKAAVTQLNTALQSVTSSTPGWYTLTGPACNGNFSGAGLGTNFFVNCPAENANFKLTSTWTFPPSAIVLVNGDLVIGSAGGGAAGCFAMNVDPSWNVANLCAGSFSPTQPSTSSILQIRGNLDAQGSGNLVLPGTFLDLVARGGANPVPNPAINGTSFTLVLWTAPYYPDKDAAKAACAASATGTYPAFECFRNLGLWTESNSLSTIQGGATLILEGTFFLGEAPLRVGGNGLVLITKSQFVAKTITSGGTKLLNFVPDPQRTTGVPTFGVLLIR